jgi:hypothetical protein
MVAGCMTTTNPLVTLHLGMQGMWHCGVWQAVLAPGLLCDAARARGAEVSAGACALHVDLGFSTTCGHYTRVSCVCQSTFCVCQ